MRRFLTLSFIIAIRAAESQAADLPTYEPVYVVEEPTCSCSWGGIYIGAGLGVSLGSLQSQISGKPIVVAPDPITEASSLLRQTISEATSANSNDTTLTGSLQLGYNWQAREHLMFGVVADYWTLNQNHETKLSRSLPWSNINSWSQDVAYSNSISQSWLATARLRAGLTWDHVLVYGTGGLAWGDLTAKVSSSTRANNTAYQTDASLRPQDGSDLIAGGGAATSGIAVGYALGGGVEIRLSPAWTLSGDYLFYQLERTFDAQVAANQPFWQGSSNFNATVQSSGHLAKLSLNYHLGQ